MANLNAPALEAALYGGVIREDVMEKIWDISKIPLPFTDACSKGTHTNRRVEFVVDKLGTPVASNAVVEGVDITQNNTAIGTRLGNYTQIPVKAVSITTTAEASNGIGGMNSLSYQLMMRQQELRRDVEAQMMSHQASVAGDAATVAGISAGLGAQLKTHVKVGATGAVGGFNTSTGLFVAPTPGTKRALSETLIRDVLQDIYVAGGNTAMLMARPPVIRLMSAYMFGTTAKIATLQTNTSGASSQTAIGSVNVFVTDFGQVVKMVDNRIQLVDDTATSSMYFLDPSHLKQSFMRGYQTDPLGKTGLTDKRMMSCEYSMLVLNEVSQGAILAIDEALAMVA